MKIDYELMKSDYIDFNLYHISTSAVVRKTILMQRYVVSLIYLIFPFVLAPLSNISLINWLIVFGVAYVIWILLFPRLYKRRVHQSISKVLREGKADNMLGRRSLALNDDGIVSTGSSTETRTGWSAIERIGETAKHIFIYSSELSAYIVPVRAFDSPARKDEFMAVLKQHVKSLA